MSAQTASVVEVHGDNAWLEQAVHCRQIVLLPVLKKPKGQVAKGREQVTFAIHGSHCNRPK